MAKGVRRKSVRQKVVTVIPKEAAPCPHCLAKEPKPWYRTRLAMISYVFVASLIISYSIPFLHPYFMAVAEYVKLIWWAVLVGFILGGLIERYVPNEYIEKYLSQHKKTTIFHAVLFGLLASACSHGILAIAIQLYKKGASTPSVIAFLLASPWANLPMTILLFGFFGFNGLLMVVSSVVIAIVTGLIYQVLDSRCLIECNHTRSKVSSDFSIIADMRKRIAGRELTKESFISDAKAVVKGGWSLANMVLWWIMIGIMMAGVFSVFAFNFESMFSYLLGPTVLGLLVTLVIASVIEVCSEGSSPISFEIFRQTGALGNSFAFLNAGVATDYTEIGIIWSNIGRRAAIALPLITVPQILLLGYLFNILI